MRTILKEFALVIVVSIPIFFLFWGATFILYPKNEKIIDTHKDYEYKSFGESDYYIYGRNTGLVVRGRELLKSSKEKVVILGPSTVVEGFRPNIMQPVVGKPLVHNMSLGASNLAQLNQVIDLVYEMTPKEEWRDLTFVMGIYYAVFRPNRNIWPRGRTNIQNEMLRYGLYRYADRRMKPVVEPGSLDRVISLLRPFMAVEALLNKVINGHLHRAAFYINNLWLRPMAYLNIDDLDSAVVGERYKKYVVEVMLYRMDTRDGTVPEEQFNLLPDIARIVSEKGSRLIIIDMPLPEWHMKNSPHFKDYQVRKRGYFNMALANKNVWFIDMQGNSNNADFYDFAHPKPKTGRKWSKAVAREIKNILDNNIKQKTVVIERITD